MDLSFIFYLSAIILSQFLQPSFTEVPSSNYKNLLSSNNSKIWLRDIVGRQSPTNRYCNICCLNITSQDITKDCGFHTMCIYKRNEAGAHCRGLMPVVFSENEKHTILDAHNTLRNRVASGQEERGSPGPQPAASNMRKLEWDEELAVIAKRWTLQCSMGHDRCRDVGRFPVGQNIASDFASKSNHLEFIKNWYDQVKDFNSNTINQYTQRTNTSSAYIQMVWAETYRIGCARAVFQTVIGSDIVYSEMLVCNYGPAGNIPGQPVYVTGPSCSGCYPGTRCESEYSSLCSRICEGKNCIESSFMLDENLKIKEEDVTIDPSLNFNGEKNFKGIAWPFLSISIICIVLF